MRKQGTTIFVDASMNGMGTGVGIYSNKLQIQKSIGLKGSCSILQAEIFAIREAAKLFRERDETRGRMITIFSDSQAAIRSIASGLCKSRTVVSCREALSWIRGSNVSLCWVPGHSNVEGNVRADKLAKIGANMDDAEAVDAPLPSIGQLKDAIDEILKEKQHRSWQNRNDCRISRTLWPKADADRTKEVLAHR